MSWGKQGEAHVKAGASATADQAMAKLHRFSALVEKHKVDVTPGIPDKSSFRVTGRQKRVTAFVNEFNGLQAAGLI